MKYVTLLLLPIVLAACAAPTLTTTPPPSIAEPATFAPDPTPTAELPTEANMPLQLTSDAFTNGQSIPAKYSCQGRNISPALAWNAPPAGTQSLALIVDDPDAPGGTWTHWVLFNLPPDLRALPEEYAAPGDSAILTGKNSSGFNRYEGPCPPSGTHRYYFRLYALDTTLSLAPGITKEQLLEAMDGHILAQAELMGTFSQ